MPTDNIVSLARHGADLDSHAQAIPAGLVADDCEGQQRPTAAPSGVVSQSEAEAWMAAAPKGAWTGVQFHGSTEDGAESLRAEGVLMERCREGGFYTTNTEAEAALWGWGSTVPVAVRFDNPLRLKRSDLGVSKALCDRARRQGHDGIIWPMDRETVAVALSPFAAVIIA